MGSIALAGSPPARACLVNRGTDLAIRGRADYEQRLRDRREDGIRKATTAPVQYILGAARKNGTLRRAFRCEKRLDMRLRPATIVLDGPAPRLVRHELVQRTAANACWCGSDGRTGFARGCSAQRGRMSSILDIGLDYFNLVNAPSRRFKELMRWGKEPIAFTVERHHHAFRRWRERVERGSISPPEYILHVDEHHDMMDQQPAPNIANVMYHAMRTWPGCRVHWLVEQPIDSPRMWLDDEMWERLSRRFTLGHRIPDGWPEPDLISVCTSPEFVREQIRHTLIELVKKHVRRPRRAFCRAGNRWTSF